MGSFTVLNPAARCIKTAHTDIPVFGRWVTIAFEAIHLVAVLRGVIWATLLLLAGTTGVAAQEPAGSSAPPKAAGATGSDPSSTLHSQCDSMSRQTDRGEPLAAVCEFARSLERALPNVICNQQTERYTDQVSGQARLIDTVEAQVSYLEGKESYNILRVNGIPANNASLRGGWSSGDYATALHDLFSPEARADFKFDKTVELRGSTALVYKYRVDLQANHLWFLQDGTWKVYPGYGGKLWIDSKSLRLMRMEKGDIKVDARFPIQRFNSGTDYSNLELGDGTSFNLPTEVKISVCDRQQRCLRQDLTFKNWHKFGATSRILSSDPPSAPVPEPSNPK